MNSTPCSICQEAGHHARRCPELSTPLRPGFYAPSGGGRYTGDDEDEKLKIVSYMVMLNHGVYRVSSYIPRSLSSLQTSTSHQRL